MFTILFLSGLATATYFTGNPSQIRYRRCSVLSHGGSGLVVKAVPDEFPCTHANVAIKCDKRKSLQFEFDLMKNFSETRHVLLETAYMLDNPNECIVMKLLGPTLEDLRTSWPQKWAILGEFGSRMIDMLEEIHKTGYVHGDFHCGNIVLLPVQEGRTTIRPSSQSPTVPFETTVPHVKLPVQEGRIAIRPSFDKPSATVPFETIVRYVREILNRLFEILTIQPGNRSEAPSTSQPFEKTVKRNKEHPPAITPIDYGSLIRGGMDGRLSDLRQVLCNLVFLATGGDYQYFASKRVGSQALILAAKGTPLEPMMSYVFGKPPTIDYSNIRLLLNNMRSA